MQIQFLINDHFCFIQTFQKLSSMFYTKKNKKILLSALFVLCTVILSNPLFSQLSYSWTNFYGGNYNDVSNCIAVDNQENVFIAGEFSGTANFGNQQIISFGAKDIFVASFNKFGQLRWVKQAGGSQNDYAKDITLDDAGNIYITGSYQDYANFDDIELNHEGCFFIAKLDSNGNFLWAQQNTGKATSFGCTIAVSENSILVGGMFQGAFNILPYSFISNGATDIFIANYSFDGNLIFAKSFCSKGNDILHDISVHNNKIYLSGTFTDILNWDNFQLMPQTIPDGFQAMVSFEAILEELYQTKCTDMRTSQQIAPINNGTVYHTGHLNIPKNTDNPNSGFHTDIFVSRINTTNGLRIENIDIQHTNCTTENDGQIHIFARGGEGEIKYSIDGGANFQTDSSFTNLQRGFYDIAVCDVVDTISDSAIEIHYDLPIVSFTGLDSHYCEDYPTDTLYGSPAEGIFSGRGISGNTFNPQLAGDGTFFITYTYTSANACTNSDSMQVVVIPVPEVNLGSNKRIKNNEILELEVDSTFSNFLWNDSINSPSFIFSGKETGIGRHFVYVSVTSNGCSNADTILVTVDDSLLQEKTPFFEIFPNPVKDNIKVYMYNENGDNLVIELFDYAGRKFYTKKLKHATENIELDVPVNQLDEGIYILRVKGNNRNNSILVFKYNEQ